MKKKLFVLSFCLLFLSACGQTSTEENTEELLPPSEKNLISDENIASTDEENAETEEGAEENTDEETTGDDDITQCEEKSGACIEELEKANQKIKTLEANLKKRPSAQSQGAGEFKGIVMDYLNQIEQKEYAFDACGAVSKFYANGWYNDFKAELENEAIFFSLQNRSLKPEDFFGGCASSEGKTAFFLGAGFNNESEFHMLKYDYENKVLSEVILPDGACNDCPVKFGKRNGAYIELFGENDTVYRYYFDKNILSLDSSF